MANDSSENIEFVDQIVGTKGVHCAGVALLIFELGASPFSPAVVSGTAQYELFSPREMLLWRSSVLLFVYKHKNIAKLKKVLLERKDEILAA